MTLGLIHRRDLRGNLDSSTLAQVPTSSVDSRFVCCLPTAWRRVHRLAVPRIVDSRSEFGWQFLDRSRVAQRVGRQPPRTNVVAVFGCRRVTNWRSHNEPRRRRESSSSNRRQAKVSAAPRSRQRLAAHAAAHRSLRAEERWRELRGVGD